MGVGDLKSERSSGVGGESFRDVNAENDAWYDCD